MDSPNDNLTYYEKYLKYKKKYLEAKSSFEQSGGGIGRLDIEVSGHTLPKKIYQQVFVKYHDGRYLISINLPIFNMGPLSFPVELQNGKVYTISNKNGSDIIKFKYRDGKDIKEIEFIVDNFMRKRFSLIRGNQSISIL